MAAKEVKMTAPNGANVTVAEDRVESLTRSGFTQVAAKKATPAKKAAAKKSSK